MLGVEIANKKTPVHEQSRDGCLKTKPAVPPKFTVKPHTQQGKNLVLCNGRTRFALNWHRPFGTKCSQATFTSPCGMGGSHPIKRSATLLCAVVLRLLLLFTASCIYGFYYSTKVQECQLIISDSVKLSIKFRKEISIRTALIDSAKFHNYKSVGRHLRSTHAFISSSIIS